MARILIVDDEQPVRGVIKRTLENNGHQCHEAADVPEARSLLKKHDYELVLTDIVMPGETGLDLIRFVSKDYPDVALMIISLVEDEEVINDALSLHIYGYIMKPFDTGQILVSVENALRQRELEIENRLNRENLEKIVRDRTADLHATIEQLTKTEKDLRESEKKYRLLIKTIPSPVYRGYADWSVEFIDDKIEEVTGYKQEEFHSRLIKWSDIILEEDLGSARDAILDALKDDKSFVREYRIRKKTGEISWIEDRGQIICNGNGKIEYISGVFYDITDRKGSENAILCAKEEWEKTFNAVPDLIMVIDENYRLKRVNKALADRLGFQAEEILGLPCYEVVHGTGEHPKDCPVVQTMKDGKGHISEMREQRLGGDFIVTNSPLYDTGGRVIGGVCVSRDITERKQSEEKLKKARNELEGVLGSISSILIGINPEDEVTRWNKSAERVFGLKKEEVIGNSLEDCPIDWDWPEIGKGVLACREKQSTVRLADISFVRVNGKPGILGISLSPIVIENVHQAGVLILASDITERKLMESQLSQAQKLEAIGQLAAGIAHEINTPTQYVGDNTHFLQEAFSDFMELMEKYQALVESLKSGHTPQGMLKEIEDLSEDLDLAYLIEEIPKAIEQALEGVGRVAKIVRAMKEFSHPGTEGKSLVDINHVIENTITVARNEWKYVAEMVTEFDSSLPPVPCLPGELNQVILNIVVNAAHAISDVIGDGSEEKGTITIETRQVDSWCEIRISDTGPGIPEKIRSKVFDPFFTTKEVGKGTGQGLTIAYQAIVEKHKGTIHMETEMGKGTTFIIRLPLE